MSDTVDRELLIRNAVMAGETMLDVYERDCDVETKDDTSPLTEADRRSNDVIIRELKKAYPDIPFISEETKATVFEERKSWERFWLIDPLDGTKEFVKKNDEFTVNIALVEGNRPVAGVVHQPVGGRIYHAAEGAGSYQREGGDGQDVRLRGQAQSTRGWVRRWSGTPLQRRSW